MKNLKNKSWSDFFSHIYVENDAFQYEITKTILKKFKNSEIISIKDYKNIFSNTGQDIYMQKKSKQLILAKKKDNFIYEGAKVCNSFGNENFYYTSSVVNCIFDCGYCYLKGMYSSSNIVIFVNIDDFFDQIKNFLLTKSMYLCISYDTDLLGINGLTDHVSLWYDFAIKHKNLKIELRTKSNNFDFFTHQKPNSDFIIAFTLSPKEIIGKYEIGTASLESRLSAIKILIDLGYSIRICFDPIIYTNDFYNVYKELVNKTFSFIDAKKILDVSIGTFRISKDYLKKMRKNDPKSLILSYPFICENGVYSYESEMQRKMLNFVNDEVLKFVCLDKVFVW